MSNVEKLEKEALNLTPQERERLVLAMWDSLEGVTTVDPEGFEIALRRDAEINAGFVEPISHSEFRKRTHGSG